MSDSVEVRRAEVAEAEAISRVVLRALRETNAADCPPEVIEEVRSRFANRAVFVATLDGRVVGTASLDGETLRTVFVDPERQAQGVGRALVRAVVDLARARGVATLVVPSSITAEGFYRKLGFAPVRDEFHGGERTIVMERRGVQARGAVQLRTALPDDAEAMLRAHRAAVGGTARAAYDPGVIDAWAPLPIRPEQVALLADRIRRGEEEAVVAHAEAGGAIGWGSIVVADQELRAVYVDPRHERGGVGGVILGELEARAHGRGLRELRMDASLNAEAFYRRHGFEVLGPGEHVLGSGLPMACVRMRKLLLG